jgi:hypothetical protein
VAQIKETRITDLRIDVGIDDTDRSKFTVTVNATTRDNDGTPVTEYRQDITDEVTPETIQVLVPLIERAITRLMTDRAITPEDLEEGETAKDEQPPLTVERPSDDIDEGLARRAQETREEALRAEQQREAEAAAQSERAIAEGEAYARRVEDARLETERQEKERRKLEAQQNRPG